MRIKWKYVTCLMSLKKHDFLFPSLPLPFTLLASPTTRSSRNQPHKAESSETVHFNIPDSWDAELVVQRPGRGEDGTNGESSIETYTWNRQWALVVCEIDSQWKSAVRHREPSLMLRDILAEEDAVGDGREAQEGGGVCIPEAESCWCMAETNTVL